MTSRPILPALLVSLGLGLGGRSAEEEARPPHPGVAAPAPGAHPPLSFPGNLVLNGSFESDAHLGCVTNLSNAAFTARMWKATALGLSEETDLICDPPCSGLPAAEGRTKVALATRPNAGPTDAISLELERPLVPAHAHVLTSSAHADSSPGLTDVRVGVSTAPDAFGTQVLQVTPVDLVWNRYVHVFEAPVAVEHLTVQNDTASSGWSHLDDFVLLEAPARRGWTRVAAPAR